MKPPKKIEYIKVGKAQQRGWIMPAGMFRAAVMAIIMIVVVAILITGINAKEKEKEQQFPPRLIIYKLELVWENDSLQVFDFHKGAYRSELFYDKINDNWFR